MVAAGRYIPSIFNIETVMGCNAKCIMCRIADTARTAQIMKDELFEKIAVEIASFDNSPTVTLQLLGEPLIDKKLEWRIWVLKELGVKNVSFSTNGSLMTAKRAQSILDAEPESVRFSIEASTKETFEKIRVGLDFETVRDNTINFFKARDARQSPTVIRLLFIRHEDNINELEAYLKFWQPYLVGPDTIEIVERHNFGNGNFSSILPSNNPCGSPMHLMVILADGEVSLCCGDADGEFRLGNVAEDGIIEIFNNQRFAQIRNLHQNGARDMMKLCSSCNIPEVLAATMELRADAFALIS